MFKFQGIVEHIGEVEQITEKFSKRLVVINDGHEDYPQVVPFELVNDKTQLADNISVGDEVTVSFNLRGREWTAKDGTVKYFGTNNAFNIEGGSGAPQKAAPVAAEEDEDGDLPF